MYADIILLAIISFFLVVKLISILGQKNESAGSAKFTTVNASGAPETVVVVDKNLTPKDQLKLLDPGFSESRFLDNSIEAFKMILEIYAKGDTRILSELVDIDTLKKFAYPISARDELAQVCEINILKINSAAIENIKIDGNIVDIAVKYSAEAVMTVKTGAGKLIAGHENKIEQINDSWVFRRNVKSPDPTWKLVGIGAVPLE